MEFEISKEEMLFEIREGIKEAVLEFLSAYPEYFFSSINETKQKVANI